MRESLVVPILESSQVGDARRKTAALASKVGFSVSEVGSVSIAITEIAGNLVKHAERGEIIVRAMQEKGRRGLEILAVDHGPGMRNPEQCIRDGFSTTGTPGAGLGAISRLAADFDIYSVLGVGSVLMATFWKKTDEGMSLSPRARAVFLQTAGICAPMPGETVSGDGWMAIEEDGRILLMAVDGLGHGPIAAAAAEQALQTFTESASCEPGEIIQITHNALRSTRGAALAIAEFEPGGKTVKFAGVGNIGARIRTGQTERNLVSSNGIVGHQLRNVQEFTYPWSPEAQLILHSDGLITRWDLDRYPGLSRHHPSLTAATLYRDFRRSRDDITVVVARQVSSATETSP